MALAVENLEQRENGSLFGEEGGESPKFLRPLVEGWLSKIEFARKARADYDAIVEQCTSFYQSVTGFMWEPKFRSRYMNFAHAPRFKITLNKAFEFVALFGPSLYWQNPVRQVKPRRRLEIVPEMFLPPGYQQPQPVEPPPPPPPPPPGSPPEVQQQYEQAMQQAQQMAQQPPLDPAREQATQAFEMVQQQEGIQQAADKLRCQLLETWLNYTPGEMPGGGMVKHSQRAIVEALVTGRGIMMPREYKMPGSKRTLTGCFYVPQKDHWWDPDCSTPDDAWWMCIREVKPYWQFEREYKLKKESLKRYAHYESSNGYAERSGDLHNKTHRAKGDTQDLMVVYKIWSKMGCGARLSGVDITIKERLERSVGDYAYIVVSQDVPFPLNAPPDKIKDAKGGKEGDEAIAKLFEWPIPFWKDDRWPIDELKFYERIDQDGKGSPYPIAPLEPGLGELAYMNVFMSHLANRVWSSSRDFVAYSAAAAKTVKETFKSGDDMAMCEVPGAIKDLKQHVTFIQQPQLNPDAWRMLDRIAENFEKRVGLNELMYGRNAGDTQSRTATDAEAKREMVSVRPDYMAGEVESHHTRLSDMEKFASRWKVEGPDVKDFGPMFSQWWVQHITDTDPEVTLREVRATIEAGSARKPNKQRDAQNMNAILPVMFPELSKHADATGDTNALNGMVKMWGKSIDQEVDELLMGPRVPQQPPVPPEQQQMMEQQQQFQMAQMQLQMQQMQAQLQKMQMEVQVKAMDLQVKQAELQGVGAEQQMRQQELQFEQTRAMQDMYSSQQKTQWELQADQQRHGQELAQDQQRHEQDMSQTAQGQQMTQQQRIAELQAKMQEMQMKLAMEQQIAQSRMQGEQATIAAKVQGDQMGMAAKIQSQQQMAAIQADIAMKKAQAKPKKGG